MNLLLLMLVVPVQPGAEFPLAVADSKPPSVIASLPVPPDAVTVSERVVVWVVVPPAPVIVNEYVPVAVDAPTVIVKVELPEPGAAMEVGLKPAVAPVGRPLALSATAALKPPETAVVTVEDPEAPRTT